MQDSKYQKRQQAQQAAAVVGVDAGKRRHALVVRARGGMDSTPLLFDTTRAGFEKAVAEIRKQAPDATPPKTSWASSSPQTTASPSLISWTRPATRW